MVSDSTEKWLWDKKFPDECQQLPLDYLETEEKALAEKCINKEDLTETEKSQIKQLLYNYRPFFKKYNSDKAVESIENNLNVIKTENELLRLLHDPNRYRIDMNYWLNGVKYVLQLRIKPITEKQHIDTLGTQLGLFKDLKQDEKKLIAKAETQQPMSAEETKMYQALMDKINEKVYNYEYNVQIINEFLASRVEFVNTELNSFEERLSFWKEIDLNTKTALFTEVRGRLRLSDTFQDELFPPVR